MGSIKEVGWDIKAIDNGFVLKRDWHEGEGDNDEYKYIEMFYKTIAEVMKELKEQMITEYVR